MIEELLKHRGKLSSRLIAEKYGMSVSQLNYKFKKLKLPPLRAGRPKVPFDEQMVDIYGCVKRKYFKEAQAKVKELIKQYR